MFVRRLLFFSLGIVLVPALLAAHTAQTNTARERAKPAYEAGIEHMRAEAFEAAARSFQQAVDIDPVFDLAYYMLGRAQMAQKNYAAAVIALTRCRDLYSSDSTRQFTDKQERQRSIRERLRDIEALIESTERAANDPRNATIRSGLIEDIRQYQERKRQLQDFERNDTLQSTTSVPAFVSLALGSAYFRSGKLDLAERAYLAAVSVDPKVGEAHNNLAVVYMETGRYEQAEKAVKAAEKAGLRVAPALKAEIQKRKKSNP